MIPPNSLVDLCHCGKVATSGVKSFCSQGDPVWNTPHPICMNCLTDRVVEVMAHNANVDFVSENVRRIALLKQRVAKNEARIAEIERELEELRK